MNPISLRIQRHSAESPWTYRLLDEYQRELQEQILAGKEGELILSELAPVVTRGRGALESDFMRSRDEFEKAGIDLFETDRGGKSTYHGPGQWVLFPIERLEVLTGNNKGVRKAVDGLLEIAREVSAEFGINCEIREGEELGLWSKRGKVASVGIKVSRGILLHGVALNVFPTKESFFGIHPCGLDARPDFLFSEVSDLKPGQFEQVGFKMVEIAERVFGVQTASARHFESVPSMDRTVLHSPR